jgi:UDP-N-acetylmuramate: L-alanyl-gamma-D-glutamyl-meso-diaminopimelate ligase
MKHIHFIGICGAGMAGIATMMTREGYIVTGSDEGFYDPIASYLMRNGFTLTPGYRPENIPKDADTIIIGKHAKLTPTENTEVAAAFALREQGGLRIFSFPELLEEITKERQRIVICGSYGKSTVSALVSWCLSEVQKDPGYFIGAQVYGMQDPCVLGTGPFIFEGDEYPSANWDDRSKFEFYHPHHILLTSGEHDHVNVFKTHASFLERFDRLISALPKDGICIGCIENDSVEHLLRNTPQAITYGLTRGAWHAENINWGEETTFDLYKNEVHVTTLSTTLLGKHNIQNIVGACALLLEIKSLSVEELARSIASFKGVKRRLDRIDNNGNIPVYEGFGSSYAKARSAIEAIALHYPHRKIYCVFEPHTFSWRDPHMAHWYKDVFDGVSDIAIVNPPASHGKDTEGQLSAQDIVESIGTLVASKEAFSEKESALVAIRSIVGSHEDKYCILILTSGEALGIGSALIEWSESK